MPCLSGQFNPDVGILVQLGLLPGGTLASQATAGKASGVSSVNLTGTGAQGLIDTGADSTCIAQGLATLLGLQPIGAVQVNGATGQNTQHIYLVDLILVFGQNAIPMPDLEVIEMPDVVGRPYAALIGRDIICKGVLTMDFNGRFTFSV